MIKNGVYNLLGGGVRLCLGLATVPILIKVLGLGQYGLYALINAIISFAVLSEWSIAMSLTVFLSRSINVKSLINSSNVEENSTIYKSALIVVIALGSVTALMLYILIPYLSVVFSDMRSNEIQILRQSCQLSIFLIWVRIFQQLFIGIEQAYEHYGAMNAVNTAYSILMALITMLAASISHSLIIIFYCQFILTILCTCVHAIFCFKKKLISLNFLFSSLDWNQVKEILRYSLKTWFGSFGSVLFSQGDRLIVGNLLGSEVVGIYAAMTSITSQINSVSAIPMQTIVPQLSQTHDQIESGAVQAFNPKKMIAAYSMNLFLALLLGCGVIGFAPEALALISAEKTHTYSVLLLNKYFIILGIIYTVYSFNAMGYYVLLALQETSIFLWIQLISGIITLLFITVLTYKYGLSGAIVGNSLYLLVSCFTWYASKRLSVPIGKFIKVSFLPICLFFIFVAVVVMTETFLLRLLWTSLFGCYATLFLKKAVDVYKTDSFFVSQLI